MANPKHLSFATFNLYNLQLPGVPMYRNKKYTQKQYDDKIAWTAKLLQELDADIIGFQELWHKDCLKAAFEKANLGDSYNLVTYNKPRKGVSVALAYRKHLTKVSNRWIEKIPKELVLKKRKPKKSGQLIPDYKVSVDIKDFSRPYWKSH